MTSKKDKVIVSNTNGNIITQDMVDYWAMSEVFDASIPDKDDEISGIVDAYDTDGKAFDIPLKDCVACNWDCEHCRKPAVKMCLCCMNIYCWFHLNKHVRDNIEIVIRE